MAAIALAILIDLEHKSFVEPSLVVGGYLFFSLLLDTAQARSLWLRHGLEVLAAVFIVSMAVKIVLLLLEEVPKVPSRHNLRKATSPEAISGAVSRSLFWWLNVLLRRGYHSLLTVPDLLRIPRKFDTQVLLNRIGQQWQTADRNSKYALCLTTFRAFALQTLCAVPPRLALSVFTFSQPFLINRVIERVEAPARLTDLDFDIIKGLIGATALIYIGIAISTCIYNHITYQLVTMIRGAIVTLIFQKTLSLDTTNLADGAPVTLMSTDIDGLERGVMFMHEIWAAPVEFGLGIYLLYREIGTPCFLVLIPILSM